jgi:excisionase family DNA binding protein
MQKLLVSIDEASDALSISKWTLRKYIASGVVRTVKMGTRRLVSHAELERLASEGLIAAQPGAA